MALSLDDRRRLLRLARRSVECAAGVRDAVDTEAAAWSPTLRSALAVFVSLHRRTDGKLRGCIGCCQRVDVLDALCLEPGRAQPGRDIAPPELATAGPETVATVVRANFADASYDRAIADLERTLAERRAQLDPKTVASIARSLQAIDRAIAEAREALESDPGNVYLNSYFASARQRKLDLLRRASALAHTES